MEELSKQLSIQLNETITINGTSDYHWITINVKNHWSIVDDKNKITIYFNKITNITLIIQMYNEVREYKNNINKEYNLDCCISITYDNDNLIKDIKMQMLRIHYDNISDIYANNYLECSEKIKKIEDLKNQLILLYGKIEDDGLNNAFELSIKDDIITIQFSIYSYNSDGESDLDYSFSINTNKMLIFEIYNQFKNYINSFNKIYYDDNNGKFFDLYVASRCYIDMIYKNNENNIYIYIEDMYARCIADITINSNSRNSNITSIIEIYKEVNEYFRYGKSCLGVVVCYSNDNLVKEIDAEYNEYHIYANNYIEFTEKLEKVRKQLEKEEERKRLEKEEEKRLEEERIAIELYKILKEDVIIKEINNNSFIILGQCVNTEYKIKIEYVNIGDIPKLLHINPVIPDIPNIFPNIPNISIYHIYNTVKRYINLNLKLRCCFETHYAQTNIQFFITKFTLKCDDYEFSGKNYIECDQKILEYIKMNELKLREQEQEKVVTILKLKYGNKTDWTITYKKVTINNYKNIQLDLTISDIDIEYIDLLDIIPNYQKNIILNGFIRNTNYVNYKDIKYKSGYKCDLEIYKYILNITIQNCTNLKIINNLIHFKNNCNLKIVKCPKLEFIQNYNNFSEIYIDNRLVKVVNE